MTDPDAPPLLRWTRACSANTSCVEVALTADRVLVRDSKQEGHGSYDLIGLPIADFRSALDQIVSGTSSVVTPSLRVLPDSDGGVVFEAPDSGVVLHFDDSEWLSFREGAASGVFNC